MPDDDSPRASLNSLCVTSGRRCVFGGCGNESEEAERIREQGSGSRAGGFQKGRRAFSRRVGRGHTNLGRGAITGPRRKNHLPGDRSASCDARRTVLGVFFGSGSNVVIDGRVREVVERLPVLLEGWLRVSDGNGSVRRDR